MANFGLSKPWIAKLNPSTNTYSDAFTCGKAINTTVTPNNNEGGVFADNQQTESVTEFKNASVVLGTDRLPVKAATLLFGHKTQEDETEVSNSDDASAYVGYGFITMEVLDGVKKYRACILHKVKFTEGEESYQTKGDSITFSTPSLSGTALADSKGNWRTKSPYFETEDKADAWIKEKFNVTASETATPGNGE